ncbi:MAG: restriction endonuclease subunit S [Verrucomicrobia bacterium]|nr:restriction endonuclease subunit S [Verrucomicrobiota bacterium]MCH8511934.1 restriction endonuclease subunit S [Kiritimatiellia bacterium]
MMKDNVPNGYKQTEVGVIPEDWEVTRLGEVSTFLSGGTPSRSNASFWAGNIPWISATSLRRFFIFTSDSNVTKEAVEKGSKIAPIGSTLLLVRGSALHKEILSGLVTGTVCFNQDVKALVPCSKILPKYLTYITRGKANDLLRLVSSAGNTAGVLDTKLLKKFRFPLPPTKNEQEAIAEALGDADAWIESLEKLINKKRLIKQGAMQELLTAKRRLPGFEEEWGEKRLGDCLEQNPSYGINAPAVPYHGNLPKYLRITDITEDGRFKPDPLVAVDSKMASRYFLQKGDVVFARTGASVGKSYRYRPEDGMLVFAGFLIRIQTNQTMLDSSYFSLWAHSEMYWKWVKIMSMRSGQPGINGKEFSELILRVPPIEEQTAIAEVLSDMDAEIEALEAKLEKARRIKEGMMAELLTGKTRLVSSDLIPFRYTQEEPELLMVAETFDSGETNTSGV